MDTQRMLEGLDLLKGRYDELTRLMSDPDTAQDYEKIAKYAKERSELQESVEAYRDYRAVLDGIEEANEMLGDEDAEIREMAQDELQTLTDRREALEERLRMLLVPKDPRDEKNVIIEIRAGAGGDEAGLFAAELFRLYTRYAEAQPKWKTQLISANRTGIGGFKEVVFSIEGKGAFSRLKFESGVHRVQRVPSTESSGRIHTSTVTVAVLPEVDDVEIDVNMKDVEITTYGSSGPGGQHMQKNDTAVRMVYKPTGLVVTCESERSLTQNKLRAMRVLRARLYEAERQRQVSELDETRRSQVGSGQRSHNLPAVMEGDIDQFIESLTLDEQTRRLSEIGS